MVTDVLSFPLGENGQYDTNPETGAKMLGEIMICVSRAQEQAEQYGHSFRREIAYLTAHSMLHLLGYDHEVGGLEAVRMREKEETVGKTGAYVSTVPLNNYIISIMPYFAFDSFTFSLKNQKNYYAPILSVGKYDENYLLPIAATVNHAVCDGYHVSELFRRVQEAFDNPAEYLSANENTSSMK